MVLKGKLHATFGELWTRRGLVIFQSILSVILIVSTLVVYRQIDLVHTKNLGYDRTNIIYFEKGESGENKDPRVFENDLEGFLQDLKRIPGVLNATNFRHSVTNRQGGTTDVEWEGKSPDNATNFTDLAGGYDLIETLGIQMKEGRTYSREFGQEKSTVVVNEKAIEAMGLKDPIGKTIKIWGGDRQIIGVAKDFHFQSLYEEIKPLFFDFSLNKRVSKIMVKFKTGSEKETIEHIRKVYALHNPGLALEYSFLDTDYQKLYEAENKVALLSKYFTGIAIVISCLGLFGLSAFSAERRFKEIGIRKVLGASEFRIIHLLSTEFTKITLASLVIALPVSYTITRHWLDSFSYRIDLTVWYFIGAGLAILITTWFAVGIQTVRAAMMNPVKGLRTE